MWEGENVYFWILGLMPCNCSTDENKGENKGEMKQLEEGNDKTVF